MKTRWPVSAAIVLLVGLAFCLWLSHSPEFRERLARVENPPLKVNAAEPAHPIAQPSETNPEPIATPALPPPVPVKIQRPAAAVAAQLAPAPEPDTGLPPMTVMENMRSVLRQYSSRFGGNPVGNNREITAALTGKNQGQAMLVNSEDGLRINERGELIDNWGTPFFFHQVSGTLMEIHSAGPDKKMWTDDDLVMQ